MEIAKGNIGPETTYIVGTDNGIATASIQFQGADGSAHVGVSYSLNKFLDNVGQKVKDLIPGTAEEPFVDMVVDAIKKVLK